jgi:alcohol dehydrogenase class IV
VAVPTTAGTGAEVTRNAVIAVPAQRYKASMRSPHLYPRAAVVDPELTLPLPPSVTASTGLDALTQLIEAYVSVRATPLTDALALTGLRRASGALRRACQDGSDLAARADMALAALLSGIALANASLGAVHGFASPLGGRYPIPHGTACAALLPHVTAANLRALRERDPEGPALSRYRDVAGALFGHESADLAAGLAALCRDLGVPPLNSYGVRPEDAAEIVEAAMKASSTRGYPIALTAAEMTGALAPAIG